MANRSCFPAALDQGYWPDGVYTAPTDAALRFDVEAAKRLGLVAVRKHLKIEPERYYYWADRLGLLDPPGLAQRQGRRSVHRPAHLAGGLDRLRDGAAVADPGPLEPSLDHRLGDVQRRLGPARYPPPRPLGQAARPHAADR